MTLEKPGDALKGLDIRKPSTMLGKLLRTRLAIYMYRRRAPIARLLPA
jgi:hypothetical protein